MNVEERVRQDWEGNEPIARACLSLWSALQKQGAVDHFTFGQLQEWAKVSSEATAQVVMYMSAIEVLRSFFMYESTNGELYELPREELLHFEKGEHVVHPQTGLHLQESDLLAAFEPGTNLRKVERR